MTIRAVLFDLDETLLDRTNSLIAFLGDQHARFNRQLGDVTFQEWRDRFLALDDRGRVHKSRVYPAILAEFGGDATKTSELLADYETSCCRHARPIYGMAETLRKLRTSGHALGIVTNGATEFQRRHIETLGLDRLADAILISESEGLRKPDAALFHRAAERLGVDPAECLFVGDDPVNDILGADGAGMRTAWFHGGREWPATLASMPGIAIDRLMQALDAAGAVSAR